MATLKFKWSNKAALRFKTWREEFGAGRLTTSVSQFPGVKQIPVDERISPDLSEIGHHSSYFFLTDSSHYLKRHVETLQIKSASFARRRLTVDVQLPCDEELGRVGEKGDYEFWIPVTFLTKHPPRSNIDLRDDRGCAVPLLTRSENSRISLAAALRGAEQLLKREPSRLLASLLAELITCDGIKSEVAFVLGKEALESELIDAGGDDEVAEKAVAFIESLRILSGNYALWVGFNGRPGERRMIKFHYDIEFDRQGVLRQRRTTHNYLIYGRRSEVCEEVDVKEVGDGNPYSPLRRMITRLASTTGLGAVNVGIESPYVEGSDSYHLQVESPPGVETRDIDIFAVVDEEDGQVDGWKRDHGAHLYVNRARLDKDAKGAGIALLTLRIGRRGFMTLAWLSAVLSATILWLFDLTAHKHIESPEATAAVLLFGPALLAALVVRPGEHPVATKLFSGIRFLVGLNGLLVIAAAAAVAEVRPEGWSFEHVWFLGAIIATASAAVVTLGWIFSWDTTYLLVKGLRRQLSSGKAYRRLCAWLLGLTALLLALGGLDGALGIPPAVYLVPATALELASVFVAAGYAGLQRSKTALIAINVNCLVLLAAIATLVQGVISGWQWEKWWLGLTAVSFVAFLALLFNALRWKKKRAGQSTAEASSEVEEIVKRRLLDPKVPNWLRQTPSAARVLKEARKNATGIPDLLAPSAYREVEPAEELIDQAGKMYAEFLRAWVSRDLEARADDRNGSNGSGETESAKAALAAEKRVKEEARKNRRELIVLDL